MSPRVSIILPVYNGESYLNQCLNSLIAQSMTDFEVIVGDDGSRDRSPEIIANFADDRFRVLRCGSNQGLFANINRLLPHAHAPLIRFLCQDDLLEPACLSEEVTFFDQHPSISMAFSKTYHINAKGTVIGECVLGDMPDVITPELSLQLFYYFGCLPGNLSTVTVRREYLERGGLFNASLQVSADYEMWVRLCKATDMGVIHQHLVSLRIHEQQLSRGEQSGVQFISENRTIRNMILPMLPTSIRGQARRYAHLRQEVIAVHHAMRCLTRGEPANFLRSIHALGWHNFVIGGVFWLVTANNHLYMPSPRFAPLHDQDIRG
jgi:glycosyltransferase involved in cell wall biosynthesis